jgi:hypothetical protein
MNRIYFIIFISTVYLSLDFYFFTAFRSVFDGLHPTTKRIVQIVYWAISIGAFTGVLLYNSIDPKQFKALRIYLLTFFFVLFMGKLFGSLFLFIDDLRRGLSWIVNLFPQTPGFSTSRSDFLSKTGVVAATVPVAMLSFGVISGAYDYRVRRRQVYLKNLPRAFDGIRVAQVSDIHTGSFFNKTAVRGGVDLLLAEKPDLAFFTGDLVNDRSEEAKPYLDIFKRIKAPLGTYSVMGNHDYGDYTTWSSKAAKRADVLKLQDMHRYMGYSILLNENRRIKVDGEEIGILGCENWGSGRFSKYGDMSKTALHSEDIPFKILLSHDPSHWDAQIRKEYQDIDLTLSGHTHGFQFGVEIGDFKWSPVQYRYSRWADLYQEEDQFLYVNRGFGFIGYPGRVGILPEITILELKSLS